VRNWGVTNNIGDFMKFFSLLALALFSASSFANSNSNSELTLQEIFSRGYKITVTLNQDLGHVIEANYEWGVINEGCMIVVNQTSSHARIISKGRNFDLINYYRIDSNWIGFTTNDRTVNRLKVGESFDKITLKRLQKACHAQFDLAPNDTLEQASELNETLLENNV
jgi:hypothetical protein